MKLTKNRSKNYEDNCKGKETLKIDYEDSEFNRVFYAIQNKDILIELEKRKYETLYKNENEKSKI